MQTNQLPIWRNAQRLLLITEEAVRHFPRYHNYTLGREVRAPAKRLRRLINCAQELIPQEERG